MLQKLPPWAITYLKMLYQASYYLGYIPEEWRTANMIFIPKPGKPSYSEAGSFRPITLSSFLFKGMERIVLWLLYKDHFSKTPMISSQFAFMKGRSTETAISRAVDKIESALLRRRQGIGVFLDIKGAFDNLDHEAAIAAMRKREMPETFIAWYSYYLENRTATITLAGITMQRRITKGTPQGGGCYHLPYGTLSLNLSFVG